MAKLENYVELARQTAREIAADGETWRSFLQTASSQIWFLRPDDDLRPAPGRDRLRVV